MVKMTQLMCKCLNVQIHIKEGSLTPVDVSLLHIPEEQASDPFFQNGVGSAKLAIAGITKHHDYLCRERKLGKWTVNICINCNVETHASAVVDDQQQILINLALKDNPVDIKTITLSEEYSPVFKIILSKSGDAEKNVNDGAIFNSNNPWLENAIKIVQQQVSRYLAAEQKALEERIRLYSQQQREKYLLLQEKVQRDQNKLISLMLQFRENDLTSSLAEAVRDSPKFVPDLSPKEPPPPPPPSTENFSSQNLLNAVKQKLERKSETPHHHKPVHVVTTPRILTRSKSETPRVAQSFDVSAIFSMEGLDDEHTDHADHAFSNSDDEADTDESSTNEDMMNNPNIAHVYATSLPIDVPKWLANNHPQSPMDKDEDGHSEDPEDIAASIRALAMSVRDEMFGDLPRPRLNTGDIIKSRPLL